MATTVTHVSQLTKQAAKGLMERHPGLKKNRLYFEVQRARAYRAVGVRPELTDRPDLLQQLVDAGIAIVPNYVSRERAQAILAACEDTMEAARSRALGDDAYTVQPDILWRVATVDRLVPETAEFFADETIRDVMRAYLSPGVQSFRQELEYRFGVMKAAQADLFHFDNWRPIAKAFLYLTDVGPDNAPFAYIPGTHTFADWKRPFSLEYDVGGASGRFGHFFPQEIRRLRESEGWPEEIVCTGSAGTLILADFRGLHRGTPLRAGRRVLLNNTFDLFNAGSG